MGTKIKNKLPPDFYALFTHIPTAVLDLIILRKCTYLMGLIARRGHVMHSLSVIVDGCGTFKATNKRLQERAIRRDKASIRKSARKHYKKNRLKKISQFI